MLDDETRAFTGDCLLIRGSGRTDFQQGDAHAMFRSVRREILTLPSACLLYPAHDYRGLTVTSVEEERRYNPRLGGDIGEDDFVGYMNNLGLPHPEADGRGGAGEPALRPPRGRRRAAARARVGAAHLHLRRDLRDPAAGAGGARGRRCRSSTCASATSSTGRWAACGARRSIPLGELAARADELARDRPIVTVCRSGARSAQAVVLLAKAGFADVANLAGGVLRWRAEGHPVEGARD